MSASPEHHTLRRHAVLQLILVTAAWGISFPLFTMLFRVQQANFPGCDTYFLASHAIGIRSLGAAAFFLLLRPGILRGLTGKEWRQGALLGFFGGTGLVLQADGLSYTSAPVSAFLTQFYCVLLPLWFCLYRRKWLPVRLVAATVMVVAGISLLSGLCRFENGRLVVESVGIGRGELETLAAAVFFTVQILLLERPVWRANRMVPVTVVMFLGFALCALPVVLATKPSWTAILHVYQSWQEAAIMGTIIIVCTVFAYTAMNRWQPHVTATEGGLIYCLEPVFTTLYALFLPALLAVWTGVAYANDALTFTIVTGGSLITAANILLQIPSRRPKPAVAP